MKRSSFFAIAFNVVLAAAAHGQFTPNTSSSDSGTSAPKSNAAGENHFEFNGGPCPAGNCAPQDPNADLNGVFVFRNNLGTWKVGGPTVLPVGEARYRWIDGTYHHDQLVYLGAGSVFENDGAFVPVGSRVPVWAFRSQDVTGNAFYVYFGTQPIVPSPRPGRAVYPVYYSFQTPATAVPRRLLTNSGTSRE